MYAYWFAHPDPCHLDNHGTAGCFRICHSQIKNKKSLYRNVVLAHRWHGNICVFLDTRLTRKAVCPCRYAHDGSAPELSYPATTDTTHYYGTVVYVRRKHAHDKNYRWNYHGSSCNWFRYDILEKKTSDYDRILVDGHCKFCFFNVVTEFAAVADTSFIASRSYSLAVYVHYFFCKCCSCRVCF